MTLEEQIAALPPRPDVRKVRGMEALAMDAEWHSARLALTRRVLQAMVDACPCRVLTSNLHSDCYRCADARRVLEATQ